jgi:hypothetical protein
MYIIIPFIAKCLILLYIYTAVAFPLIMAVIFTYSDSSKRKNGYLILIFAIASATVTFWYVVYYIYVCIHPYIIIHECLCIRSNLEGFKCKNGYLILIFAIASATVTF